MLPWLVLGAVSLAVFGAALTFAVALGRAAAHADESIDAQLDLVRFAAGLNHLSDVRSPSGRRFFPTPGARRELTDAVEEVLEAAGAP
jgi:hypothetical protein